MRHIPTLWKANAIAFTSSFCVMVIELIASRILAPYIGVSLYTWTSIIGVILAGIALGNYLGGKIADRFPSPIVLAIVFFAGGLLTVATLPAVRVFAGGDWFRDLPVMWNFVLKTAFIFFLPAIVLSMVSPLVIKLTLADLGRTGNVVGSIYAWSTAGAILGTFMTGFYLILWFGIRAVVWLVAAVLIVTGIITLFSWEVPNRWRLSLRNFVIWTVVIEVVLTFVFLFQFRENWPYQGKPARESNYYTIRVLLLPNGFRALRLDHLVHSYVVPGQPAMLGYGYLNVFTEIVSYVTKENPTPRVLHLGGGGYSFPQYLEVVYPGSVNEVVEIDPAVTQVAHEELGLPLDTHIKTYNQDARLFLMQRKSGAKYNIVVGDVFNDLSTPYHLTTLEFDKLVKANMAEDGIYLLNIVDDYRQGRYLPSFIYTLRQAFKYVYLFSEGESWDTVGASTFVVAATDRRIEFADFKRFIAEKGSGAMVGNPHDEIGLEKYLAERNPILLTDDHAPTDILIAPLFRQ